MSKRSWLLGLVLLLGGCGGASAAPVATSTSAPARTARPTSAAASATATPVATATLAAPATPAASPTVLVHVGPPAAYARPDLTPGDALPVTKEQVCTPGYSKGVRDVTSSEKAEVFRRYGVVDEPGKYEVDHLISLELGGSNAVTNLWPEPISPPPGAHEKDRGENYLHEQVCAGKMTLADAQHAEVADWVAIYQQLPTVSAAAPASSQPQVTSPAITPAAASPAPAAPAPSQAPVLAPAVPTGATFQCRDGSHSFAKTSQGACSYHGGIAARL